MPLNLAALGAVTRLAGGVLDSTRAIRAIKKGVLDGIKIVLLYRNWQLNGTVNVTKGAHQTPTAGWMTLFEFSRFARIDTDVNGGATPARKI